MLYDVETARSFAAKLLKIKAVVLNVTSPFTWASGWYSPIYCDNRLLLSFPEIRDWVKYQMTNLIKDRFTDINAIGGVATAGIPYAAILADSMSLPMIYVRSGTKSHGTQRKIEGHLEKGWRVLVIEDLISTGESSLKAVRELKNSGAAVAGLIALFTYSFELASQKFESIHLPFYTLSAYPILLEVATKQGYINSEELKTLEKWRLDPKNWKP